MFKKETNTGQDNSGNRNSGNHNTGNHNSGNRNSGNRNSGYCNSGNRNSGYRNSGYFNTGNCNTGNHNSGNRNSGDFNSGDFNSGNHNSGNHNSGYCNSGFFNTDEPTVRLFNKDTGLKRNEVDIPYIFLPINEWIPEEKMTEEHKKADPEFYVKGGTLITRTYKEAWVIAWQRADQKMKDAFLNLPNFDADIFLEITGIDVCNQVEPTCDGKVVEIEGKKYRLTEVEE